TYYAVDTPTCTPAAVATCTVYTSPFTIGSDGVHALTFFSKDVAGNVETPQSRGFKVDTTRPTITATLTPPANAAGWNKSSVTVSWTCTDPGGSGIASCSPNRSVTAAGTTQVSGTATDLAGNTTTVSQAVNIDQTKPSCALTGSGVDST